MNGPTSGAQNQQAPNAWISNPLAASMVKIGLFCTPVVVGWLAVYVTSGLYLRPVGWAGTVLWLVQAVFVASTATFLVGVLAERFSPLTTLLSLNLVFPDAAPSRYAMALRAGTVRKLAEEPLTLSNDEAVATRQALELVTALSRHDRATRGHVERVRAYSMMLAEEVGLEGEDLNKFNWAILLHDVGKAAIPPEILNKTGRPTDEEWEILQTHPTLGGQILAPLADWLGDHSRVAVEHHERWDGTGYPAGLAGEEISLAARICAIADTFDVITSKRSYKEPLSAESARQELVDCAGSQFDPALVRAFLRVGVSPGRNEVGFLGAFVEFPRVLASAANLGTVSGSALSAAVGAVALTGAVAAGADMQKGPGNLAFDDGFDTVVVVESSLPDLPELSTSSSVEADTMLAPSSRSESATSSSSSSTVTETTPLTTVTEASHTSETAGTTTRPPTTEPRSAVPFVPKPTPTAKPSTTVPPTTKLITTNPPATNPPATKLPTTELPTTLPTVKPTVVTVTPTTISTVPSTLYPGLDVVYPRGENVVVLDRLSDPMPNSATSSDTKVFVNRELGPYEVQELFRVRKVKQGKTINGNHNPSTKIAVGETICSFMVTAKPVSAMNHDVTITFKGAVLGVLMTSDDILRTDFLKPVGANYDLDGLGSHDQLTITGSEITFHADHVSQLHDMFRVITSC